MPLIRTCRKLANDGIGRTDTVTCKLLNCDTAANELKLRNCPLESMKTRHAESVHDTSCSSEI